MLGIHVKRELGALPPGVCVGAPLWHHRASPHVSVSDDEFNARPSSWVGASWCKEFGGVWYQFTVESFDLQRGFFKCVYQDNTFEEYTHSELMQSLSDHRLRSHVKGA